MIVPSLDSGCISYLLQMVLPLSPKTQSAELLLYSGLIESHLGKRASVVASALFNYGRLSIRELSKRSNLPIVLVKKTLVSLIQLKCVSFWEEKTYKGCTTFYYFREDGVLMMLYSGEIIAHIEETYQNETLTQIVQNFLSLGNLSISEYVASFGSQDAETTAKLEDQFTTLVQDKYLVAVQKSHFHPLKDIWMHTLKNALTKVPKAATTSELRRTTEAKAIAKLNFTGLLELEPTNLYTKDKTTMSKKVNPTLPLAFNIHRFLKSRRSLQLTQLCSHRVGKLSSIVYKYALKMTERDSIDVIDPLLQIGLTNEEILNRRNTEPKTSVTFAAKDLANKIPSSVEFSGSVLSGPVKRKATQSGSSHKRVKLDPDFASNNGVGGDDDAEDDDDDFDADDDSLSLKENRLAIIDQHLKILTKSAVPFLKGSNGSYHVPYHELITHLKTAVSDSLVTSTLGTPPARVLRCVRDNRLVSEKLINSVALLREKDARSLTSILVKHNLLQIQEVPKSADRAASKSVFLYRVNEKHLVDTLMTNICWNMGRIIEKQLLLKLENANLISKINRDDVRGKELEYLLPSELTQLKQMRDQELTLTVKFHRLATLWEVFKYY